MPNRRFFPPSGGDQTSSVLITGDSSGIVLQNCEFVAGAGAVSLDVDADAIQARKCSGLT